LRFLDPVYIDSGSITGSLLGTASYAISSSYAETASYVLNTSNIFPYIGDAIISGSLNVSGSITGSNGLKINGSI
jgi:hypothetical protein